MGETGEDIKLSAKGRKAFPYAVECKNQEKYSGVYKDFEQAKYHVGKHRETPILFVKMNRQKPLAIMDFDHFMKLVG